MKFLNIVNNFGDLVFLKCLIVCMRVWVLDMENFIVRMFVIFVILMYIWKNNNYYDKIFKMLF